MFQPWRIDDFVPAAAQARRPADFWEPDSATQKSAEPLAAAVRPDDFWDPIDNAQPQTATPESTERQANDFWDPLPVTQQVTAETVADWSDDIALPLFQRGASENPFVFEDELPTRESIGRRRARWLASLLDIPSGSMRRAFADKFEELFDDFPHQQTFRVLSELALEGTRGGSVASRTASRVTILSKIAAAPQPLRAVFDDLEKRLRAMGGDVSVHPQKHYVAFRRSRNFACVQVYNQKKAIRIFLNLDPDVVGTDRPDVRDVRQIGHYGTGDLEVTIRSKKDLEGALELLKQSYDAS